MSSWKPGDAIVLREVWRGKVLSIVPVRVVQDASDLVALYLAPRTLCKLPQTSDGEWLKFPVEQWTLGDTIMTGYALSFVKPGAAHTLIAVWDERHFFDHWKVDLIQPMRRTSIGFDYLDQILDIIVSADRSEWYWKDEDELRAAQLKGIVSPQQARELFTEGERAIGSMRANQPPFDREWEKWSPDSAWKIPDLPQGWDFIS